MAPDILVTYLASYLLRIQTFLAYCVFISLYLRRVANTTAPGSVARVAFSAPIVLSNFAAPALFSRDTEICTALAVCFLLSWLGNFKVIGLCLNRGSLTETLDPVQFATVLCMPITPQTVMQNPLASAVGMVKTGVNRIPRVASNARLADDGGTAGQLVLGFLIKGVILGVVVFLLGRFELPVELRNFLYILGMYAFLSLLMDGPASLATSMVGLRIAPHFDQPYLSSSIADFWSRRWNLTAGNALRFLVYDPIMEGRLVKDGDVSGRRSHSRRQLGVAVSFVVSGMVHELILRWSAGAGVHGVEWRWFLFFSLQGPLLAAESELKKWAKGRKIELPRPVAIVLTCGFLLLLGDTLFFYPAVHSGLADRVVGSLSHTYKDLYQSVTGHIQL
ncbi:g2914 [Coccomyxa viridis]|uniref:G2914 protein n=1 Tax=Coccomyxa viridis TaxID=1274662 RepID=A0ABP1FTH2_9CHLO